MKCNVKEKTVPFEFDGKTFQLKFNLNVIAEIQEKYEDLDSFFEKIAKVGDMLWLLCLLINQDVKKHNKSSTEKWEYYTVEQIGEVFGISDIKTLSSLIADAVMNAMPSKDTEENEKNATAE